MESKATVEPLGDAKKRALTVSASSSTLDQNTKKHKGPSPFAAALLEASVSEENGI